MKHQPQTVLQDVRHGNIKPLYLFHGDVDFLKQELITRMIEQIVPATVRSFNYDRLYGKEIDAPYLIDVASQLPMMSKWRVVVVHEGDRLSQKDKNILLRYLANPTPSTCLIFLTGKINLQTKFYHAFLAHGIAVEFAPLYDHDIIPWLKKRATQKYQKQLTSEAAFTLHSYTGSGMGDLDKELEKLALFVGDRAEITEGDVRELVGVSRTFSVFDLTDAIAERKTIQSISILEKMLSTNESEVYIVSMLVRHFFMIWKARTAPNVAGVAKLLHVPPFIAKKYYQHAKNFSPWQLAVVFESLYETDLKLKTSSGDPKVLMEFLVYRICTA
ncbi:MAG: DNA polymerase III subunit delta [Gemmatimonadetes bacterium]|nr:MAG: DNA polymerase III subunit delta [Gemmatimonadota bacterium]